MVFLFAFSPVTYTREWVEERWRRWEHKTVREEIKRERNNLGGLGHKLIDFCFRAGCDFNQPDKNGQRHCGSQRACEMADCSGSRLHDVSLQASYLLLDTRS